jgi:16S rRNA (adenine1518-N6/adenine1519-N6)-dimethyltransferase
MGRPLRVVGNLPYNISTPILFHLLEAAAQVADQHFMLQKEVVQRMAAAPGGKDYGRLSVMLQWRYRIEPVLAVPPEAFEPPPAWTRRWCACGRCRRTARRWTPRLLGALVTVAFSQRRKLLRHTLGRWLEARGFGRHASTCSAAPRKCRWRSTWRWREAVATLPPHETPQHPSKATAAPRAV